MLTRLSSSDFNGVNLSARVLNNKVAAIIMFSKSTCPWCIRAKPEYEKLAKHPAAQKILVAIVEDDPVPFVSRYPTFKIYDQSGQYKGDTGTHDRTLAGFMIGLTNMLRGSSDSFDVTHTPRMEGMRQYQGAFDIDNVLITPRTLPPRTTKKFFFQ